MAKFFYRIWNDYKFSLKEHTTLNHEVITEAVTSFFDNHVNKINDDEHIIVLVRFTNSNDSTSTLGPMKQINKNDSNFLIEYIEGVLHIKADSYMEEIIKDIIFSFGIRKGAITDKHIDHYDTEPMFQNYRHYKLPITMEPKRYGKLIHRDLEQHIDLVQITPLTLARITEVKNEDRKWISNQVDIIKDGEVLLSYEDKWIDDRHFKRIINEKTYYFSREGDIDLFTVWKPTRYIKPKRGSKRIDKKVVTLDIETRDIDNQLTPYLICYYDGKQSYSFFLTDYNSPDEMLKACISSLLVEKYNNYKIYIHNLANFDGIFLLRNLVKFGELNVLLNKGKLISIDLTVKGDNEAIKIYFRDSYQILLASLSKLGVAFKVDTLKSLFPYDFVNNHSLDYKGMVPAYSYFDSSKVSFDDWIKYVEERVWSNRYYLPSSKATHGVKEVLNNMLYTYWNLKDEAIKYCINDCVTLYEVLIKFNNLFFKKFKINISEHPTLPGLAFRLFRTKYLKDSKIPMIYGDNYKRLKLSYTGGAVDMFIPTNEDNELVYAYDVNSLYPFIMSNFPMPIGQIRYFEGDIRKMEPEAFGFFYCKIEVPSHLEHPILQTHVNTKSGIRTIAGGGIYHDMIFSHSYDLALKYGYKINILWGYTFQKGYIFKDFVTDLYNLRLEYPKSDPMNYIAKINLNSLYGKFGMRDDFDKIKIVNEFDFNKILNDKLNQVKDVIKLDDHYLVQLTNEDKFKAELSITKDYNINVAIASAITSYSRDYMAQFKNNPNLKLFYTDTDSIYTSLSPEQMNEQYPGIVSNSGLGKLKLEGIFKRAIFLAPKCYCLQDLDGKITYKVKGLMKNVPLTFKDFEALLLKDAFLDKSQTKWFKDLGKGVISVLEQSYTLRQTDNKRELILKNGKVIAIY